MVSEVSAVMRWQIPKTATQNRRALPSMQDLVESRLQSGCPEHLSHTDVFALSRCNDMPSSYVGISTTSQLTILSRKVRLSRHSDEVSACVLVGLWVFYIGMPGAQELF